jgi:WD40 repeat protein
MNALPLLLALLPAAPRLDAAGDPLPDNAVARLGSSRLRHGGAAVGVAVSPDGRHVYSAGSDRALVLWSAADGRELARFRHDEAAVRDLALSPDGKTLAAAGADGVVRLYDATPPQAPQTRGEKARLTAGGGGVETLAFAADGRLAAGTYAGDVLVFQGGRETRRTHADDAAVRALAFSPDGKHLAAAAGPGGARLWSADGVEVLRLRAGNRNVRSVAFAPDGKSVAVGTYGNSVHLYDLTGRELAVFEGHQRGVGPIEGVFALVFGPDGKTLASGGADGTVRLWDIEGRREKAKMEGHHSRVTALAFGPARGEEAPLLASGGLDGSVRLWDTAALRESRPAGPAAVSGLALAPDGKSVALLRASGTLGLTSLPDGPECPLGGGEALTAVAFAPSGKAVAAGTHDGGLRVFDAKTGREVARGQALTQREVLALAYAPDGKMLASAATDWHLTLWDAATGKATTRLALGGFRLRALAFAPDGLSLAGGGDAAEVHLWEMPEGRRQRELPGHAGGALALAFGPGGRVLASGGKDRRVRLWELASGRERGRPIDHAAWVRSLALTADGRFLASGADDGVVRLWDMAGRLLDELPGHRGPVTALAFGPGDGVLVSAGLDGTALVWDVAATLKAGRPKPVRVTEEELQGLWQKLGDADGPTAGLAMQTLARAGGQAVPLLAARVKPVSAEQIRKALRDLDDEDFDTRERATRTLRELGRFAEPGLRDLLRTMPPLEVRQRVVEILRALEEEPSPEYLRALRAVEVLDLVGSPEARKALEALAGGAPESELTRQAKAALRR